MVESVIKRSVLGLLVGLGLANPGLAQLSADGTRAVVVVDPTRSDSMYLANYYKAARNIPDANLLYLEPHTQNYTNFTMSNAPALIGTLDYRNIADHADFVVLMPTGLFRLPASGLVTDGCVSVNHFAISSAFTISRVQDEILAGVSVGKPNGFFSLSQNPARFSSQTRYFQGSPSTSTAARRYYIGGLLGYPGQRGNTVQEMLDLIDRSTLVDGTRPAGTFYFMETTDVNRSGPRDPAYPSITANINALGGGASHLMAVLPDGQPDCLGIMTGWATPDIVGGSFTLLPGSFGDHLTSFAGNFATDSQTKMSQWITKGASGSLGAVEEPCNYAGKFPRAHIHRNYFLGMTLGEAYFRSASFLPFQMLLYGDPLTRPFAHIPAVTVPDAPAGTVSGIITITPSATTTNPGAAINTVDLLIDGVLDQTLASGIPFQIDTTQLADGHHELRVIANDDSTMETPGLWVGSMMVNNQNLSLSLSPNVAVGDLDTAFDLSVAATGAAVQRIDLLHNGRIVATTTNASDTLTVFGQNLGAGPVKVSSRVTFADGRTAIAMPIDLDIAFVTAAPTGPVPVTYSYERTVFDNRSFVIEFPASFVDDPSSASYTVVTGPTQASIAPGAAGNPYRVLTPQAGASGADSITFRVSTPSGISTNTTISIQYTTGPLDGCIADLDNNGVVDVLDFFAFVALFNLSHPLADLNNDGNIDVLDFFLFVQAFNIGCV